MSTAAPIADPQSAPVPRAPRRKSTRWRWFLLIIVGCAFLSGATVLVRLEPPFYHARLCASDADQRHELSNQFLNSASRLINDLQNSPAWEARFGEDQINGWLAEDFEQNHAAKSLPHGVTQPRVAIEGDRIRLGFRWQWGPVETVIQIAARTWVPKRNILVVELESAKAGWLTLPTTYTRRVIEQFISAQNLDISWKRHGRQLVAIIDFQRAERKIVLRRVEVSDKQLHVEGLSGRHAVAGADYAPSAN